LEQKAKPIEQCPEKIGDCPLVEELHRLREECKRLMELSQRDTLTGLFNLRYFLTALETEMERTRRAGLPTSLIMIDLDHFKRVNDTYGHDSGNLALQWATKVFQKATRKIDILCRYGGEEFSIILPGTRLSHGMRMAERLRLAMEQAKLELDGDRVALTASFGVYTYKGKEDLSVEAFIKLADSFLLEAKTRGRNRVCCEETQLEVGATEITVQEREALLTAGKSSD
jgi:two-component system cell cycle response regulator